MCESESVHDMCVTCVNMHDMCMTCESMRACVSVHVAYVSVRRVLVYEWHTDQVCACLCLARIGV